MNQPVIYLVVGPQGSGKSTQAKLLSERFSIPFFDAGDALRSFAKSSSPEAAAVAQAMKEGKLVKNETLNSLLRHFIAEEDCSEGFVIDGFPRSSSQAELLEDFLHDFNWQLIIVYIDIPRSTAIDRLANRHQLVNGQKVVRADDQPAVVEKRLKLFYEQTYPVVDELSKRHHLLKIDGTPDIETIADNVARKINELH